MASEGSGFFTEGRQRIIEERIARKARSFDVGPLLQVLSWLGYAREDLRFEGNPEPTPSRSLVEAVRFEPPQVIITLNVGLNGHRGLLPGYFEAIAETLPDPGRLHRFIQFFEHPLLRDWVDALTPEQQGSWQLLRDAHFAMINQGSVSTLTWLFGLYFPELGVRVRRTTIRTETSAHALIAGHSRLDGSSVLGARYQTGGEGFEVVLESEDERDPAGRDWWRLAAERLAERVLPLLGDRSYTLVVVLVIRDHESWARLARTSQLGYERIEGEPDDHRLPVYQG